MRPFLLFTLLLACLCAAQDPLSPVPPPLHGHEPEKRLPNGKLQSDEILKAEYEKSLKDVHQLVELSQSLQTDMEKQTSQVLSVDNLKRLDEIDKIAKRIRGRMRRF